MEKHRAFPNKSNVNVLISEAIFEQIYGENYKPTPWIESEKSRLIRKLGNNELPKAYKKDFVKYVGYQNWSEFLLVNDQGVFEVLNETISYISEEKVYNKIIESKSGDNRGRYYFVQQFADEYIFGKKPNLTYSQYVTRLNSVKVAICDYLKNHPIYFTVLKESLISDKNVTRIDFIKNCLETILLFQKNVRRLD